LFCAILVKMNDKYKYSVLDSNLGKIYTVASKNGLSKILIGENCFESFISDNVCVKAENDGFIDSIMTELKEYLNGFRKNFSSYIDVTFGTKFQRVVWDEILKIPFGEVITYKRIAQSIGQPKAARAVGNAVGANPIPIVIPCHRVVGSNGLGGYSLGLDIKRELLSLEGINN